MRQRQRLTLDDLIQALTPEPPTMPPTITTDISDDLMLGGIVAELYQLDDTFFDFDRSEEFTITGFRGTETFRTETGWTEEQIYFECTYADDLFRAIPFEEFDQKFHARTFAPLDTEFASYAEVYFQQFEQQTTDGELPDTTLAREILMAQVQAGFIRRTDDGTIFRQGHDTIYYLATSGEWVSEHADPETEILQLV